MIRTALASALMSFGGAFLAWAQTVEPSSPSPAAETDVPTIEIRSLVHRPSMQPLFRAVADGRRSRSEVEVEIDYDAGGTVTAVRLTRSSGNGVLDKAVLDWSRQIRLKPGAAGTGRLPFEFTRD